MKKPGIEEGAYARRVHEDTRQYIHLVLEENEKLRELVSALSGEKERLQQQVAEVEQGSRRLSARYAEVERENSNLVNLYVASYRLHGTLDRDEVLGVIQEIVANLVGSEEVGVFEMSADKSALVLVAAFGIDPARYWRVPVESGLLGRAVREGRTLLAAEHGDEDRSELDKNLTACVPLKLGDDVIGAIAVFRLLPQKAGVEPVDRELFDLLATHAATALYCTALHRTFVPRTRAV